jgi:chemotaxis protein methyltransferase CheR
MTGPVAELEKAEFASSQLQEFVFTDADFHWLRKRASAYSGILLPEAKRNMIYGRLSKRLRRLKLKSFVDYRKLLEDETNPEFGEFINAITTNLTSFYRERHHFDHLREKLQAMQVNRRVKIWSTACSTGEEPYTIAMVAGSVFGEKFANFVDLDATDLDTNVLAKARSGVYDVERLEGLPQEELRQWWMRGAGANAGKARAKDVLRRGIRFSQLNLIENWIMQGPFDFVFCRNVVIYFDKPTQAKLFDRIANVMTPNGYLYIGHAESLAQVSRRFRLTGKTTYQRIS